MAGFVDKIGNHRLWDDDIFLFFNILVDEDPILRLRSPKLFFNKSTYHTGRDNLTPSNLHYF